MNVWISWNFIPINSVANVIFCYLNEWTYQPMKLTALLFIDFIGFLFIAPVAFALYHKGIRFLWFFLFKIKDDAFQWKWSSCHIHIMFTPSPFPLEVIFSRYKYTYIYIYIYIYIIYIYICNIYIYIYIFNINKVVFAISNRKTKTSELLLIKYLKTAKLFVTKSHHQVCTNYKILYYSANR